MGQTANIPVQIIKNNISSISYQPETAITIKKDDYTTEHDENSQEFKYYDWEKWIRINDGKLIVQKTDSTTTIYDTVYRGDGSFYFESLSGDRIWKFFDMNFTDNQFTEHWTVGNTYYVTIEYAGKTTQVPVSVVDETQGGTSSGGSSGGGYYPSVPTAPTVQKPTISTGEGYTVASSADGKTATITVKDGYKVVDVLVNGVYKGAVTTLTDLKTGDKVEVQVEKQEEPMTVEQAKAELSKVTGSNFKARSKQVKMKSGKKAIKIVCYDDSNVEFDGYEIFRSTKKNSAYGKKPIFTTKTGIYYNTAVKKGKTYYYKMRGYIEVDGVKYYSRWSKKAWRKVK